MATTWQLRVIGAEMIAPEVRLLRLDNVEGEPFTYAAGQWLAVHHAGYPPAFFSLASAPVASHELEIAVRMSADPVCGYLHTAPLGEILTVSGPGGGFATDLLDVRPTLMVATGTGVAPFRAMLRQRLSSGAGIDHNVTLLSGHRDRESVLWQEELESYAVQYPSFAYHVTLSSPAGDWRGMVGWVQQHVASLARTLKPHIVLLCGHAGMVQDTRRILNEVADLPANIVISESH